MSGARWMTLGAAVAMASVVPAVSGAEEPAPKPPVDERARTIFETPLVVQVPGIDAASIAVRADLAYTGAAEGPKLDVYSPPAATPDRRFPVVIFVHGGPLPPGQAGTAMSQPKEWRLFRDWGKTAAALGWVGVVPNHRYTSLDGFPTSAGDLDAVFTYLRTNAETLHLDPDRVAIWLFSGAGPHLGPVLDGHWPGVRCAVGYYPVLDLGAFAAMGMATPATEIASRFDLVARLRPSSPPLLLVRAGLDNPALLAGTDAFIAAALARGPALDVLTHPTGRHGFDILDDQPRTHEVVEKTFAFLRQCLEPGAG